MHQNKEHREKKKEGVTNNYFVISVLLFLFSFSSFCQDSTVTNSNVNETKSIPFQNYFFKALSQKAIHHYQKAIDNLDQCNELIPNNKTVFFELSKNYYYLNKIFEAIEFAKKALVLDPKNKFILKHLVTVYKKDKNFTDAIKIQKKIVVNHPKEKEALVILHFQNRDYSAVKNMLEELEKANMLTHRLRKLKIHLAFIKKKSSKKKKKPKKSKNLEEQFLFEKKYKTLEKLLRKLDQEKSSKLATYSKQGLELFPAQPFVYLMNAKALNTLKEYKQALETLQNGIDFVIDDKKLIAKFYHELAKSYLGLGNKKEADKYFKKAKQ